MHAAKPFRRLDPLKTSHRPDPLLDSSMVLFQMIIQIPVRAMSYLVPEHGGDGAGISGMPITGDSLRDATGDCARGPEESFCRGLVALLTEPHVDEIAVTINGAVEVD